MPETALVILGIVNDWVIRSNEFGGVYADDLVWDLWEAGFRLSEIFPEGSE